jgi:hypothetical protein
MTVLVDRGSVEVFDGNVALSAVVAHGQPVRELSAKAIGGTATLRSLVVNEMKSAWRE